MSYFPLDRNLLTSSTWSQGTPEQFKVWVYLLLEADPRTGVVSDADPGIALRCGLPLAVTQEALEWLAAPDPLSRTKDHDGRRLERLPAGGLRLLNYGKHRDKDYSTPRVRSYRERKRAAREVKRRYTVSETTDTDTDTDKRTTATDTPAAVVPRAKRSKPATDPRVCAGAERFMEAFNLCFRRRCRVLPDLVAAFGARVAEGYEVDQLVCLPILASASQMPEDLRRAVLPSWLLRTGKHARTGADGHVWGGKNWVEDTLQQADRTTLWQHHTEAARAAGVLEVLLHLGVRVARAEEGKP